MPVQIRRYATLNRYHVSTMAYRAEKLTSTSDANGSLLDNTVILFGSNMGNSNQHQHFDVPHILVGGRNLGLQGNRHQSYERKTTTTGDLLLSIMDLYGINRDEQGESTGRLAKLLYHALIMTAGRNGMNTACGVHARRSTVTPNAAPTAMVATRVARPASGVARPAIE